ncbi:ABC transporter permease [Paenibacillus sp. 598K]|uniref:ABC transporter permease n=1 Tax=Paenibacillus sp. 598K TaxID=1117987 RepID=UPI000FFA9FB1|nr:ABC transporter permease [Paenibacillus sp. 598K]GBF73496.1 ABC transporter permease [Paenibacillus sp. 598K]
MRITEMLRLVWLNIIQNKFKVILSSLGIMAGAATIVLVIAIGKGGEVEITKQFGELSAATIFVSLDESQRILHDKDVAQSERLNVEHVQQIKDENPYLKNIMLADSGNARVTLNGEEYNRTIQGVTPEYEQVLNLPALYGEGLTEKDEEDGAFVAVLGYDAATANYGAAEYAVGEYIIIHNMLFKVVGVLPKKGTNIGLILPDTSIFIPYSVGDTYIFSDISRPQVIALANDVSQVKSAMRWIRSSLHYLLFNGEAYMIEDAGSRMETAVQSAKIMSMILISVATIVFIVSGIGIMNVLFVSIKERTREIGILKALGCSERNIWLQFLLESITISFFGSLGGMLLSVFILPLMAYVEIPVLPSVSGQLAALFFSLLTGTAFGYYPAYRASRQKPIEALNYE